MAIMAMMSTVTVIQPPRGWARIGFRELWEYRELLYFLAWRDVKVRYKQTLLGASWAVIQPLLLMVVFSIFLGRLARVPSDGLPYPVFVLAALVPWTLFSQVVNGACNSLVAGGSMISKIYFPRLLLPLSAALSFVLDFFIALIVLFGMMAYYGIFPTLSFLWILPLTLLAFGVAVAVGTGLAALNARYRDVRYAVPFLLQLWLFASPIAYPTSLVPERWRTIFAINPITGVVEGFRWALLRSGDAPGSLLWASVAIGFVMMFLAVAYFRRVESSFADVI